MTDADLQEAMAELERCIQERDQDGAERILDEDYALVLVHPLQAVLRRAGWLELLPRYVVHEYQVHELVTDVTGDCASSMQRATMRATVAGDDRSGTFVISDTWLRRPTGWRLWRRHSTPLSAGRMPGVG